MVNKYFIQNQWSMQNQYFYIGQNHTDSFVADV
jgi:hypothetical protein